MDELNLVVFSKDRACQLHALLTSMRRHVREPWQPDVLYLASDQQFAAGYERAQLLNGSATLHPQSSAFKDDVLNLLDEGNRYTMFLVDDMVFRRTLGGISVAATWLDNTEVCCLSLRLSPQINYTYTRDIDSPAPLATAGTWRWGDQPGDWGYPMSVDGHVFRTSDILPIIHQIPFNNPNEFEARLAANPIERPLMACLAYHVLLNIPVNRVQHVFPNRHANRTSAWELNSQFLAGMEIDTTYLDGIENNSVHFEAELRMTAHQP